MLSCWQENSRQRPSFHSLKLKFNDILASKGSDTYVDFCIDPNKLYYKTDDDSNVPATRNFLRPSPSYKRRSKKMSPKMSPNGSFEGISITKTSPSPHASPRERRFSKNLTPYVSMDKVSSSQPHNLNMRRDERPRSMMVLKPEQDQQKRRKSGHDQDVHNAEDDRYVQEPSLLFGVPNAMLGNENIGIKHINSESDGKLHFSSS